MDAPAPPPRRRLRRKTPGGYVALGLVVALGVQAGGVQLPAQWPSALLDAEELDKEDTDRKKAVYLVTVAALHCFGLQQGNAGLVCPSRLSREDIALRAEASVPLLCMYMYAYV